MNLKCKHTNYYYKKAKCSDPVKTDEQTNVANNNLLGGPKKMKPLCYDFRILLENFISNASVDCIFISYVKQWCHLVNENNSHTR